MIYLNGFQDASFRLCMDSILLASDNGCLQGKTRDKVSSAEDIVNTLFLETSDTDIHISIPSSTLSWQIFGWHLSLFVFLLETPVERIELRKRRRKGGRRNS